MLDPLKEEEKQFLEKKYSSEGLSKEKALRRLLLKNNLRFLWKPLNSLLTWYLHGKRGYYAGGWNPRRPAIVTRYTRHKPPSHPFISYGTFF